MELEQQLRNLIEAGFEPCPFERYPGYLGVTKDGFAALLLPGPDGLAQFSSTGLLIDGQFALLLQQGNRTIFKAKQLEQEADAVLLARYQKFKDDLKQLLQP
jgi:hypothetical protein